MNIYLTRHGQTDLNRARRMQGRSDLPLNATGITQARSMRALLLRRDPSLTFDAVYASPLRRAVTTASLIADLPEGSVLTDERLIEADFGKYEGKPYSALGPRMSLYWACPELFPAPPTVETTGSMVARIRSFLAELKERAEREPGLENVLITCHGGIIRVLSGCLEGRPRGYRWRPKPKNCEVRIYGTDGGGHRLIAQL